MHFWFWSGPVPLAYYDKIIMLLELYRAHCTLKCYRCSMHYTGNISSILALCSTHRIPDIVIDRTCLFLVLWRIYREFTDHLAIIWWFPSHHPPPYTVLFKNWWYDSQSQMSWMSISFRAPPHVPRHHWSKKKARIIICNAKPWPCRRTWSQLSYTGITCLKWNKAILILLQKLCLFPRSKFAPRVVLPSK